MGKIMQGLKESTRAVHEINKENIAAVKADTKALREEATAPHPGMADFKQAKGLSGKARVVVENIKEGAKIAKEDEKAFRKEVQSHEAYRELLENQRAERQATVSNK